MKNNMSNIYSIFSTKRTKTGICLYVRWHAWCYKFRFTVLDSLSIHMATVKFLSSKAFYLKYTNDVGLAREKDDPKVISFGLLIGPNSDKPRKLTFLHFDLFILFRTLIYLFCFFFSRWGFSYYHINYVFLPSK